MNILILLKIMCYNTSVVMSYYTALLITVWLALGLLFILVSQNKRIKKENKGILFITYSFVGIAATAEWLGLILNGQPSTQEWLLKLVKFLDYVLTPVAGGIIILQFRTKIPKAIIFSVFGVLFINLVFQFTCLFTNWMISIDETMHYSHGPLYPVYIVFYIAIIIFFGVGFTFYSRNFHRKNRVSLYSILIFVLVAITLQIIFSVRIAYIGITIGLIALFIYNSEFTQMVADEKIQEQKILITTDPLTGIFNRYAFEKDIRDIELTENFIVYSIDINGLKVANDTFGHTAGDELICGTADVITDVFNRYGKCYRTGGDEFITLSHVSEEEVKPAVEELKKKVDHWEGKKISKMSLSVGYASRKEFPNYTIDELISIADQRMYSNKSKYYLEHGIERRKQ